MDSHYCDYAMWVAWSVTSAWNHTTGTTQCGWHYLSHLHGLTLLGLRNVGGMICHFCMDSHYWDNAMWVALSVTSAWTHTTGSTQCGWHYLSLLHGLTLLWLRNAGGMLCSVKTIRSRHAPSHTHTRRCSVNTTSSALTQPQTHTRRCSVNTTISAWHMFAKLLAHVRTY